MIAQAPRRPGRALLAFACCLLAATGSPATRAAEPAAGGGLEGARRSLAAGDAVTAERVFRALVAADPGNLPAWGGLAEALVPQGRAGEAETVLAQVAGEVIDAGRWELALRFLDGHLHAVPPSATLEALAGRAAMLSQQATRAREHLARAVTLGRDDSHTVLLLAAASWELGDVGRAEALYRELAERPAARAVAQGRLGSLLLWQGRFEEAVVALRGATEAGPDGAAAPLELRYDLARALAGAGRDGEAATLLRELVAQAPRHSGARYQLARVLAREGARDETARHLAAYRELYAAEQEAVRRQGIERASLDQGWRLLDEGRLDEALARFEALPETAESLAGRASALAARGELAPAIAALERAVSLAPDRTDLRLLLAEHRRRAREGG